MDLCCHLRLCPIVINVHNMNRYVAYYQNCWGKKKLLRKISHDLQPLIDDGGHIGRHLQNNLFPILRCLGDFHYVIHDPRYYKNPLEKHCNVELLTQ